MQTGTNPRLEVLSQLSRPRAKRRTFLSGKRFAKQYYFTWAGGRRKQADIRLLKEKAGLAAEQGVILHLYPDETIARLQVLELRSAKKPVQSIARTYFRVRRDGDGFEFFVSRITYK